MPATKCFIECMGLYHACGVITDLVVCLLLVLAWVSPALCCTWLYLKGQMTHS